MASARSADTVHLLAALGAIGAATLAYVRWLHQSNTATVSITFLLVVLVVAASSRLWVAVATSIAAMLILNFFFLPPAGTLTIADPQNWVVLFAFLIVSLVASHLSAVAHARTQEAVGRRDELARLFDLSRDVLIMTDSPEAIAVLARSVARRFQLPYVAVALPRGDDWDVFEAGARHIDLDRRQLANAFATAQVSLDFDAYAGTYAGHARMAVAGETIQLVPLRVRTTPIGILAASGRPIEPGTLDTLAGVVAIAIERAALLADRKAAELTRQSDALKTALLASIGHDLRTPLTAIRVAASNIRSSSMSPEDREEQSGLILSEAERLERLVQNVLEMARIDAGAVATEVRWAYPSEIIEGAREQVAQALGHHTLDVTLEADVPVRLDPRLTAAAVAPLLENAAQYAPSGSAIAVRVRAGEEGLVVQVRDHGPGLSPADLPHLFERFYRGAAAAGRSAGTGMGLWIARGLLAAEQGRIWAENAPGGGAQFTIVVPAPVKQPAVEGIPHA
jgi:two-component system sensor histidine kinase KdpD